MLLIKYKENTEIEFAPVYFNSTAKTLINPKDSLERSFQEIFNRIDNCISKGSTWVIDIVEGEYVNLQSMSIYSSLSRSSYIELSD